VDQDHKTGLIFKSKIKKIKLKENTNLIFQVCNKMMDGLIKATVEDNENISNLMYFTLARLFQQRNPVP